MVQTVTDNEKGYSQRQLSNAKTSRDLYEKVGYPSIRDFIVMIKKNMINEFTVTVEDVMRTERINGPSVQALKGGNSAQNPAQ